MAESPEELVGLVCRASHGEMLLPAMTAEMSASAPLPDWAPTSNSDSSSGASGLMLMSNAALMKSWHACTMSVICRKLAADITSMTFLLVRARWAEYMKSMMALKPWAVTMSRCVTVAWSDAFCTWQYSVLK